MEANRDGMFSHASRHRPSGQTVTLVSGHIVDLVTHDARFPTSSNLAGSDAMNPDPDYSAAYVRLVTDVDDLEGHGFVFTIGRGNDVARYAIDSLRSAVVGLSLNAALDDLSDVSQRLIRDSQLRWLGPEKGVMHMAIGAIVNALWDLRAKRDGKPLWKLLSDLSPEEIVGLVDFRYLTDVLRPDEALAILKERASTRSVREADLVEDGLSAYTTAPGWLGYADDNSGGVGGEVGYHYWAKRQVEGIYLGPSLIFGATFPPNPGKTFGYYGGAFDVGYQYLFNNGFTLNAGGGIMIIDTAGAGVKAAPRLLAGIGWSF